MKTYMWCAIRKNRNFLLVDRQTIIKVRNLTRYNNTEQIGSALDDRNGTVRCWSAILGVSNFARSTSRSINKPRLKVERENQTRSFNAQTTDDEPTFD